MAREVGDLWPQASGSASLGAEMTNGGFGREIRPFAHVHMNSGVWHSSINSLSGIIRFEPSFNTESPFGGFSFSLDGGKTYGFQLSKIDASNNIELGSYLPNVGFQILSKHDLTISAQDQLYLSAFSFSGEMQYRGGPFEAWAISNVWDTGGPANDGFWPIAHSGNIKEMIGRHGLQGAYTAGRIAVITTSPGDLQLVSNTAHPIFSTFGTQPELNLSGLYQPPTLANLGLGDMFMMNHSVISGIVGTDTAAVVAAKALGHGTPVIHTGSGMINVSVGSGIAIFSNDTIQKITTAMETVSINVPLEVADQNYGIGTGLSSGILKVFSPGLYKVSYHITASKTVGTTLQTCTSRLEKNSSGTGLAGTTISSAHGAVGASVINNTATNVHIVNLDAGDTLRLRINSTSSGGNNCEIPVNGAVIVIEKIGPKRGAAGS